ncbi:RNA-directed DNA polymerase from mobile element jockey [Elysia marginata]|uniref:RNA-directed DNA polymerase from mobile element jockey n=1 Tax=Elysia marginata TaxID=1093978 RepID=A0AAV4EFX3_9GAST|nr:RNA-directed DNA polymerase from mobile element jockey [Elysia marginata]
MNTAQLKLSGNMQKDAKAFNQAMIDAAKVSIPRGYRKNYKPYWTPALEKLHKDLGLLKDKLIQEPSDANTIAYNRAQAIFKREKLRQCRENWQKTTDSLNMDKEAITPYVKHTLHADNFAIWSTAEHATTAKVRVQATVDKVFKWSQDWGLTINLNKTVTTKFSLKTKERDVTLTMNGQPLPTEDTQTFLGITLDKRLTWKPHIQKINQKAIRRSQIMKKLSGTKWGANSKILRQVYQGYIRPVMEYAPPAWSTAATSNLTSLSKTQNQNLRIVLGAIKSTPIKELHKQAEIDTLENRREQNSHPL